MDRSESSDSDSNSSTSWVFVYDNSAQTPENTNTFHLDCSREPIQELTEQDLLSAGSDIESDTDGVSIISESEEEYLKVCEETSEVCIENTSTDNCEIFSTHIDIISRKFNNLITKSRKFFKISNLGVGVVLTAVFLGSYTLMIKKFFIKDNDRTQNFIVYDSSKIDSDLMHNEINLDKQLEEIIDLTLACSYSQENVAKRNKIKDCVKTQYKSKEIVEEMLDSKNKDKKKMYETKERITTLLQNVRLMRTYRKPKIENIREQHCKKEKHRKINKNLKNNENKENRRKTDRQQMFHSRERKVETDNRAKSKETAKHSKNIFRNKYNPPKRNYEVKFKQSKYFSKKNNTIKESKELKNEWYDNWHKAREQLRKEYLYPNKKKKLQWYFKWMDGRDQLRHI
ncbi:hypothetical protein FQA39_LY18278 [Lamprigera yunnana]|nr:hypothetical protein FQA39_LY18278 [Lamprigera yunnana]